MPSWERNVSPSFSGRLPIHFLASQTWLSFFTSVLFRVDQCNVRPLLLYVYACRINRLHLLQKDVGRGVVGSRQSKHIPLFVATLPGLPATFSIGLEVLPLDLYSLWNLDPSACFNAAIPSPSRGPKAAGVLPVSLAGTQTWPANEQLDGTCCLCPAGISNPLGSSKWHWVCIQGFFPFFFFLASEVMLKFFIVM